MKAANPSSGKKPPSGSTKALGSKDGLQKRLELIRTNGTIEDVIAEVNLQKARADAAEAKLIELSSSLTNNEKQKAQLSTPQTIADTAGVKGKNRKALTLENSNDTNKKRCRTEKPLQPMLVSDSESEDITQERKKTDNASLISDFEMSSEDRDGESDSMDLKF